MAICLFIGTIIAKTGKKILQKHVESKQALFLRRICTQFYWCLDPEKVKESST